MAGIATDVRSLDPAAYAQAIGLQPEDCYGFLPIDHDDVTPYLYLYRDRPEYEQGREMWAREMDLDLLARWGYGPEDSLGFCPNFPNRRIYFAWRRQ